MSNIILTSRGIEDINLTGNPQITHFKKVFRRHTPFSKTIKEIRSVRTDTIDFGRDIKYKVLNEGDLLGDLFFEVDIECINKAPGQAGDYTVNHFGNSLIKEVELRVAGKTIEKHNGQWLQIYKELYDNKADYYQQQSAEEGGRATKFNFPNGNFIFQNNTYMSKDMIPFGTDDRIIGDCPLVFGGSNNYENITINDAKVFFKKFYVPLRFWFNNHNGLQLPITAMPEIEILLKLENLENIQGKTTLELKLHDLKLWGKFIILSQEEKYRFKNSDIEYLIEQVHYIEKDVTNVGYNGTLLDEIKIDLTFNHPTKYFVWALSNPGINGNNSGQGPCYFISLCNNSFLGNDCLKDKSENPKAILYIGSQEVTHEHSMSFYTRKLLKSYCKTKMPDLDRIGMYSIALNPFDYEPSGTINLSTIINAEFRLNISNNQMQNIKTSNGRQFLYLFAMNYNILKISNNDAYLKYVS